MRWSPDALVGFASRAGFPRRVLAEAVAVALATSGGDDLWCYVAGVPPMVDQRGLWGIDVVAHRWLASVRLDDPAQNAIAAAGLWTEAGESWAWAPAFGRGAYGLWLDEAEAAVEAGEWRQIVGMTSGLPAMEAARRRVLSASRVLGDRVSASSSRRRWRP